MQGQFPSLVRSTQAGIPAQSRVLGPSHPNTPAQSAPNTILLRPARSLATNQTPLAQRQAGGVAQMAPSTAVAAPKSSSFTIEGLKSQAVNSARRIAECEAEVQMKSQRLFEAEQRATEQEDHIKQLVFAKGSLTSQLAMASAKYDKLTGDVMVVEKLCKAVQSKLVDFANKYSLALQDMEMLKSNLAKQSENLESVRKRLASTVAEKEALTEAHRQLSASNSLLLQDRDSVSLLKADLESRLESLSLESQGLRHDLDQAAATSQHYQALNKDLQAENSTLAGKLALEEQRLQDLEAAASRDHQRSEQDLSALKDQLSTRLQELDRSETRVLELEEALTAAGEAAKKRSAEAHARFIELEEALEYVQETYKTKISVLEANLSEATAQLATQKQQLDTEIRAKQEAQTALEAQLAEERALSLRQAQDLQATISHQDQQHSEQVKELTAQLAKLDVELEETKAEARRTASDSAQSSHLLQQQLASTEAQREQVQAQLIKETEKLANLSGELHRLRYRAAELNSVSAAPAPLQPTGAQSTQSTANSPKTQASSAPKQRSEAPKTPARRPTPARPKPYPVYQEEDEPLATQDRMDIDPPEPVAPRPPTKARTAKPKAACPPGFPAPVALPKPTKSTPTVSRKSSQSFSKSSSIDTEAIFLPSGLDSSRRSSGQAKPNSSLRRIDDGDPLADTPELARPKPRISPSPARMHSPKTFSRKKTAARAVTQGRELSQSPQF